jgi:hypothetical protein
MRLTLLAIAGLLAAGLAAVLTLYWLFGPPVS